MIEDDEPVAVWPDGTVADLDNVYDGHYTWKSDDYEVMAYSEAVKRGLIE